jgi:hypothetical protein
MIVILAVDEPVRAVYRFAVFDNRPFDKNAIKRMTRSKAISR